MSHSKVGNFLSKTYNVIKTEMSYKLKPDPDWPNAVGQMIHD